MTGLRLTQFLYLQISDLLHLDELRLHGPGSVRPPDRPQPLDLEGPLGGRPRLRGPVLVVVPGFASPGLPVVIEEERDAVGQSQPDHRLHLHLVPLGQVDPQHLRAAEVRTHSFSLIQPQ